MTNDNNENTSKRHLNVAKGLTCLICNQNFNSGNKLHNHLRQAHSKKEASSYQRHRAEKIAKNNQESTSSRLSTSISQDKLNLTSKITVVTSTAPQSIKPLGYAFRGRRYAQLQVQIASPQNEQVPVCLDTGCAMSLIDRTFLKQQNPTAKTRRMKNGMKVRGLGTNLHDASGFIDLDFFIHSHDNVVAHFNREIHVVDNLSANALIGIDIAQPEGWIIDLDAQKLIMPKCHGISVNIYTQSHDDLKSIPIFAKNKSVVKPHSRALIAIASRKGDDIQIPERDMIYEPLKLDAFTTFPCLVSNLSRAVLVQNNSNSTITISKFTPLGTITDPEPDEGLIEIDEANIYHLVAQPPKTNSESRLLCKGLLSAAAFSATTNPENLESTTSMDVACTKEISCPNGITLYGNKNQQKILQSLVEQFCDLWKDQKCFAKTPAGEEMSIDLIPNWQSKYKPGQAKVYMAGTNDRKLIDKTFDELHDQGRLHWTQKATPFSFPSFVIWKHVTREDGSREKKGRVVIHIRALNHITLPDAYPIPTQADIIAALSGCTFISTIDCASFFYQ